METDTARDIVEREAQLRVALRAANRQLETLSCSLSHDLRAPLRHIMGFAQLLEQHAGTALDRDSRQFLTHIVAAAKQMDRLFDAFVDLARTARTELNTTEVDLEAVLEEALAAVHTEAQDRNIQWRRTRLPIVHADPILIRQVLVNLLSNAIKFTRPRDPAVIEIGARCDGASETVIFVRDNGVGFEMSRVNELFGAFRRLHRTEEFEGLGVGLAKASAIIMRHGGSIWAEAVPGTGATFCFNLPGVWQAASP